MITNPGCCSQWATMSSGACRARGGRRRRRTGCTRRSRGRARRASRAPCRASRPGAPAHVQRDDARVLAREAIDDLAGGVGRAVVDDDVLGVRIAFAEPRAQGRLDRRPLVAGRGSRSRRAASAPARVGRAGRAAARRAATGPRRPRSRPSTRREAIARTTRMFSAMRAATTRRVPRATPRNAMSRCHDARAAIRRDDKARPCAHARQPLATPCAYVTGACDELALLVQRP